LSLIENSSNIEKKIQTLYLIIMIYDISTTRLFYKIVVQLKF